MHRTGREFGGPFEVRLPSSQGQILRRSGRGGVLSP
jgi:hypothetical protein